MDNAVNPGFPDYTTLSSNQQLPQRFVHDAKAYQTLEKGPQDSLTRNSEDNLQIDMFAQVQHAMTSGQNDVGMQEEHIIGQLSQSMSLPEADGNVPITDPNSIWQNGNYSSIEQSKDLDEQAQSLSANMGNPTGFAQIPQPPPISYDNYEMPDVGYGLEPDPSDPFSQFPQATGNNYPPYGQPYTPPEAYSNSNSLGA